MVKVKLTPIQNAVSPEKNWQKTRIYSFKMSQQSRVMKYSVTETRLLVKLTLGRER